MFTTATPTAGSLARRPYLTLVATTLALVLLMGIVGTVSYMLGFTGYTPLAAAFLPLAAIISVRLTNTHGWSRFGFHSVRSGQRGSVLVMALAAALPLAVIASSAGVSASSVGALAFTGLAVLVGFVEETIFRGFLPRVFVSRGSVETVVVTSVAFALAHAVTALSPDQSTGAAIRTVVFAFLFGVLASLLVRVTGSIWPAIALHATFDVTGFLFIPRSAILTDAISILVAAALVLAMLVIARHTRDQNSQLAAPLANAS